MKKKIKMIAPATSEKGKVAVKPATQKSGAKAVAAKTKIKVYK